MIYKDLFNGILCILGGKGKVSSVKLKEEPKISVKSKRHTK